MRTAQEGELNPLTPHPVEVLILIGFMAVLVSLVVLLLVLAARRGVAAGAPGAEERAVTVVRIIGVVAGAGLGAHFATSSRFDLGANVMLGPVVFGLVVLAAVTLAELAVRPRFSEGPRSATLRPRRLRDHVPTTLAVALAATTGVALILCTWSVLVASPDDMGRAGRQLWAQCSPTSGAGRGPFPGSFYVTPYAVGVLAALVIALAAAWIVGRRTLGGTPEQSERHRRVGLTAILGAYGVVVSVPLVGLAFFASTTTLQHSCPPGSAVVMGWFALAVTLGAVCASGLSLLAVLVPSALVPPSREQVRVA